MHFGQKKIWNTKLKMHFWIKSFEIQKYVQEIEIQNISK